jgi:pyruvate/2-oxoglutarate dehydrogenase complex dihydrolipoamide acyltransferase (E2) component
MPVPVHVPRINNNDDSVRVVAVPVAIGAHVQAGDVLLEVESEKAAVAVEAEQGGYVLAVLADEGAMLAVGSVALWLGATADEAAPAAVPAQPAASAQSAAPAQPGAAATVKARLLLRQYGLDAADVPHSGERLTAAEVEAFAAARGLLSRSEPAPAVRLPPLPAPAALRAAEQVRLGMVNAVTWQRDHAVAAYLEIPFDPAPWDAYAADFARRHRLLFSPLLPLLAFRLTALAKETPRLNATVQERPDGVFEAIYGAVNLGFTVQAGETLYLAVLANAQSLDEAGFVAALSELQRRAIAHRLRPAELQGATIGFSSMARWGAARHVPVLAPQTALMVAHTVSAGAGVLGATYDHRVLSGFEAVRALRALAIPPAAQAG